MGPLRPQPGFQTRQLSRAAVGLLIMCTKMCTQSLQTVFDLPQSVWWGLLPGAASAMMGSDVRSSLVSLAWYLAIELWYPAQPVIIKLGFASSMERLSVETYSIVMRPAEKETVNEARSSGPRTP